VPTCEATNSNKESTESVKTTFLFAKFEKKTSDDFLMEFDDFEVDGI